MITTKNHFSNNHKTYLTVTETQHRIPLDSFLQIEIEAGHNVVLFYSY